MDDIVPLLNDIQGKHDQYKRAVWNNRAEIEAGEIYIDEIFQSQYTLKIDFYKWKQEIQLKAPITENFDNITT